MHVLCRKSHDYDLNCSFSHVMQEGRLQHAKTFYLNLKIRAVATKPKLFHSVQLQFDSQCNTGMMINNRGRGVQR